jgi:hypothetical protein
MEFQEKSVDISSVMKKIDLKKISFDEFELGNAFIWVKIPTKI